MARLRGEGLGAGLALGTAAVVQMRGGIPLLPEVPERVALMLASRRLTEMPEVVLVASDYRTALAVSGSLTWGKVVAIASESAETDPVVPPFPAVVNVCGLLDAVREDMLMLVDATNGVVLADPDPIYLAQYTSEHDHIAPKRRYHLEDTHMPAQTLDGRAVQIAAIVTTPEEISVALEQGADALYVPFNCSLLPLFADEEARRRDLQALAELAAGKPLLIADDYSLPLTDVLEAGAFAAITLVVPPQEGQDGMSFPNLTAKISEAQESCIEDEVGYQTPHLGADLTAFLEDELWQEGMNAEIFVNTLAEQGMTRLVLRREDAPISPRFSEIMAAAESNLLPVFSDAPSVKDNDTLRYLIGVGVFGLLVPSEAIQSVKALVRELNASECREEVWNLLASL